MVSNAALSSSTKTASPYSGDSVGKLPAGPTMATLIAGLRKSVFVRSDLSTLSCLRVQATLAGSTCTSGSEARRCGEAAVRHDRPGFGMDARNIGQSSDVSRVPTRSLIFAIGRESPEAVHPKMGSRVAPSAHLHRHS
jgi:hypothetical protein